MTIPEDSDFAKFTRNFFQFEKKKQLDGYARLEALDLYRST